MKILQKGPKIDARWLIQETLDLIPTCPEELFEMIVRHTYDPSVYEQVMEI
jgi:cell cycle arrest protein BUB2